MKKIGFLFLALIATFAFTACNTDATESEVPTEKKLTYSKVEYVGDVEGTEFQRYLVTLFSNEKTRGGDDFSKDNISLTMELIAPKSATYNAIAAGDYMFSATSKSEFTIVDSESSILDVITPTSYGGNKSRLNGGKISVSSFKDKYEIKGEVTDLKGRTLEFSFYNTLEFVDLKPSATIDFESAQLLAQTGIYSDILWGKEKAVDVDGKLVFNGILYTDASASFGSYYAFENSYDSWGGFAISSNNDLTNKMDYSNQFSVYANSTNKFAMGYSMGEWGGTYGNPIIEFSTPVTLLSAEIANSNKTYHYCVGKPQVGEGETAQDIWVNLIITGYKAGAVTKEMTISLAKGTDVMADWKKFDLLSLGEIDKLTFAINSNDVGSFGINVPTYFCIDNIAIK